MAPGNVFNLKAVRGARPQSPCAACKVRDLSICNALNGDELSRFTEIVDDVGAGPGQALFYEGDPAEHVFVVRDGCARVYKLLADGRRMITGFLFPSDIVGFADDGRYAYGCEAITAVTACRMPRKRLFEFFEEYPPLERRMLEIATNELAATQDQMLLLGRKTALEKLASFLHFLLRRHERRGVNGDRLTLPMSRSDIGDHLGLTTESVSRCFTQLKKKGVIRLDSAQRVTVADRAALLQLTGCGEEPFEPNSAAL
jgi:CRP/FNR family transcriptional regulator, anaerobic regulatory protein